MVLKHAFLLILAATLGACSEAQSPKQSDTPGEPVEAYIVVTDPQLACLVGLVSDTPVKVVAPPDPTAHTHRWTPDREQARTLRDASHIVSAGAGTDAWLDTLGVRRDRVIRVSDGLEDDLIVLESVTHSHGPNGSHSHDVYTPRPWLDPVLAARLRPTLARALGENTLRTTIETDESFGDANGTLIVTDNDAWRYPARRAGAHVLVADPDDDPTWIRVEVASTGVRRLILIGPFDEHSVREAIGIVGFEVISIDTSSADPCAWREQVDALMRAISAER